MKKIIYQVKGYTQIHNPTTEQVEQKEILVGVSIECKTQADYDANYPAAEKEAVGEIIVEGEFDTAEPTDAERIAQLEEALDMLLSGVTE